MKQTPMSFEVNQELLDILPSSIQSVVEVGCGSGALGDAFKKRSNHCIWKGLDIDRNCVENASRVLDSVAEVDLDLVPEGFFQQFRQIECWVFGDSLEHLKDPWGVLRNVVEVLPAQGYVAICVPNSQHWSVWLQMALGDFKYMDSGLLDRTHLRWFSRATIITLLEEAGLHVLKGVKREYSEKNRELVIAAFLRFCQSIGIKELQQLEQDLKPQQYVFLAQKAGG